MPREKSQRRELKQIEELEPIVIYGHLDRTNAIRLRIDPRRNECHWHLSFGIHTITNEGDQWSSSDNVEHFVSETYDIIRIKDSIDGFETDMARIVGQIEGDWTPWKTAFTSLREQLDARIAN